jgi:putative membrane protein
MFANHKNTTLTLLIGFMIGSLNKVWPWKQVIETRINNHGKVVPFLEKSIFPQNFDGQSQIVMAIILAVLGFLVIFTMEKIASKLRKN